MHVIKFFTCIEKQFFTSNLLLQKSIKKHVTLYISGASTKRLPHKTLKDAFYVLGVHVKRKSPVDSEPKPSTIAIEEKVNESSTRILVSHLYQRIQEEKMNSPKNPFQKEFLVVPFTTELCLRIDNAKEILLIPTKAWFPYMF